MEAAQKITNALKSGPLNGGEIQKRTGVWTIELYPTLMRLERSGAVTSDWALGPYPRRRVYRLAN
jgi:DNA-binding PadR family transcriptional regulator